MARSYTIHRNPPEPVPGIDFTAGLNPQQLAAVTAGDGAYLVIAGAGSGKTRTLTYRVAYLLSRGTRPRDILLLTFTNKAAREMLTRVSDVVPGAADGIWGGTFHAIGNRILRRHAGRIGYSQGFSIMDREDSEDMINAAVAYAGLATTDRRFPKASVLADIFSLSVNTGESIRAIVGKRHNYFIPIAAQIEQAHIAYEQRKKEANAMDFDDLLTKTLELFSLCPDIEEQCQFEHVLVDEYQDTNRIQADLVDRFARKRGNIMVVGDDAQSIYSWRGANFENILRFPETHPGARVFRIETNYRSVPGVLAVANAAIKANDRQFEKNLSPTRDEHPVRPALVPVPTNNDQAAFVAQRILELRDEGVPLDEIAILYRAHFHSLEVQLELTRRNIPFGITSGLRFFEQAHVKDVAAFLKFAVNPRDEIAFKRVVRLLPGIGARSADTLWQSVSVTIGERADFSKLQSLKVPAKTAKAWAQLVHTLEELRPDGKNPPPSQMLETVLFAVYDDIMRTKFANYETRRDDLATLAGYAAQFEQTDEFLAQIALLASAETQDALTGSPSDGEGRVTLSTIHQAKGLEWQVVFLVWLTEGMFPHSRSAESPEGLEEERRLFYVGITRCKDELYLSYPDIRTNATHGPAIQTPSRFLSEIPEDLLEAWEVETGLAGYDDSPF